MPLEKSSRDAKSATTVKRKKKKAPTAPIGFQLHTERLAHERDDSRRQKEEQESRQYLKSQQKLLGKKKTEEFARMRLIRPQDRVTRQRNLHQNGKPASPKAQEYSLDDKQRQCRHLDAKSTRPMLSARERGNEEPLPAALRRPRPQSAKPVLQSHASSCGGSSAASRADEIVSGTKISVRRLENCGYNPVSLTSHLLASQSATQLRMPRHDLHNRVSSSSGDADKSRNRALASSASGTITTAADGGSSSRQRIVVYMRRLELSDSDGDEAEPKPLHREPSTRKSAWSDAGAQASVDKAA